MKATVIKLGLVLVSLFTVNTFFMSAQSGLPRYFMDTKTENGKTVRVDRYDLDKSTSSYYKTASIEYHYNVEGGLVEMDRSRWDENGTEKYPVSAIKYQYGADNKLTEALLYRWDRAGSRSELSEKMNYSFNATGKLSTMQHSKIDNRKWEVVSTSVGDVSDIYFTELLAK